MGALAVRIGAGSRSRARSQPARAPLKRTDDGSDSEVLASRDGQQPWGNFHLATIVFRRALQLRAGARPRVDPGSHKLGHVAFLEVRAGAISWSSGIEDVKGA